MRHLHRQQSGMDVAETALALDLSRSGFYAHARKPLGKRRSGDAALGLEIERTFIAARPDQVWLTDITYIPTAEGWLYLAAEMDAFSRRIRGWSTQASLHTGLPAAGCLAPLGSPAPSFATGSPSATSPKA